MFICLNLLKLYIKENLDNPNIVHISDTQTTRPDVHIPDKEINPRSSEFMNQFGIKLCDAGVLGKYIGSNGNNGCSSKYNLIYMVDTDIFGAYENLYDYNKSYDDLVYTRIDDCIKNTKKLNVKSSDLKGKSIKDVIKHILPDCFLVEETNNPNKIIN